MTQLFNSAPDLLEDFKQFLPESAAQARAQAAARQAAGQAAEDAALMSNARGEPAPAAPGPATPGGQTVSGGQRAEAKMPPVGNFAPPPSASKESRKRRAPGAGPAAPAGSTSTPAAASTPDPASVGPSGRPGAAPATSTGKVRCQSPQPSLSLCFLSADPASLSLSLSVDHKPHLDRCLGGSTLTRFTTLSVDAERVRSK